MQKIAKAEHKEADRARKEAMRAEKQRQWEMNAPRREAERVRREQIAEEHRIEKEKRDAEALARKQERERLKVEKERIVAEKVAKEKAEREEREAEWRKEREKQDIKEKERQEIEAIIAAERAEVERQDELDKAARKAIRKLPKQDKEKLRTQLAELDEQIAILERENGIYAPSQISDELATLMSLDERGWLYPDDDPIEGVYYTDSKNEIFFVPDGFLPWFGDK